MHNLSRRLAIALQHEERRCQYLTREAKLMLAIQEEITTESKGLIVTGGYRVLIKERRSSHFFSFLILTDGNPQSPFRQILPKCKLARDLKEAYDRCVIKQC